MQIGSSIVSKYNALLWPFYLANIKPTEDFGKKKTVSLEIDISHLSLNYGIMKRNNKISREEIPRQTRQL